jgi:hypothetical protein
VVKSVLKWLVVMAAQAITARLGALVLTVAMDVLGKNAEVRALGRHALLDVKAATVAHHA